MIHPTLLRSFVLALTSLAAATTQCRAAGSPARPSETAAPIHVSSPDSKIQLSFAFEARDGHGGIPSFSVRLAKRELIGASALGLRLDSVDLTHDFALESVERRRIAERYEVPFGKSSVARVDAAEVTIHLRQTIGEHARLDLIFRIQNDGVAFRYVVPAQASAGRGIVVSEATQFRPAGEPLAYALPTGFGSPYEEKYRVAAPRELPTDAILGLPLALKYPGGGEFVSLTEADLHDYPHAYLAPDGRGGFAVRYPPPSAGEPVAGGNLPLRTPWRVLMIGASEKAVVESELVGSLSTPSDRTDFSWVRPGKVLFQWWNGYVTPGRTYAHPSDALGETELKRHIDFCARHGIEFFSLDGYEFEKAWYGGSVLPYENQDVTRPPSELHLPEVLRYAREKKVGVRVWMHSEALNDSNVDRVFSTFAGWGAAGVMVDFLGDDTRRGVRFTETLIQTAAKHRLTIALHGVAKPTGLTRTYPNYLSQEGVLGQEYNKWEGKNSDADHEVMIAFVRQSAGPMDTHEGAFRPVPAADFEPRPIAPNSIGTLARQLAMYVVYQNAQPMLADYPEAYEAHSDAFRFIEQVPVTWDETRLVAGDIDERYVSVARRKGSDWYLGSMTGNRSRAYSLPLAFLGEGRYRAETYADAPDSPKNGESIAISRTRVVTAADAWPVALAPAGGQAVRFVRLTD